ncbi:MAG: CDP-alcohol phosphatidyltransferase family protein [Ignavibacteriales bacterium]|nr:CDP-alcohol phosphatidyltransferase family protein [Ignavibacteriales bacterium]
MNKTLREIYLLPNLISLFRLLLFIPFILFFNLMRDEDYYRYYILVLILIAFVSDLLDGYTARKTNQISELGKIIDPLADKVLVALIVINLFMLNMIPAFYFWLIILRDILIFLGGLYVKKKIGKVLPSNMLGKATVFSIGIFIIITLLRLDQLSIVYQGVMIISITLCFASLIGYLLRAKEIINWKKNETIS